MVLQVTLAPPPDLIVTSVVADDSYVTGDTLSVVYNISNAGAGETVESFWQDQVVSNLLFIPHTATMTCAMILANLVIRRSIVLDILIIRTFQ